MQDRIQQKFQIAPVAFWGRGLFGINVGLLPRKTPITIVGESFI